MSATRVRLPALLLALALFTAACGLKEGVVVSSGGGGLVAGTPVEGGLDTDGDGVADVAAGDAAAGGGAVAGGGGAAGGAAGGSTGGGATSGGAAGGGASGGAGPATAGKVWGNEIVIGVHAPITGAAPLPASFAQAAKVYADYINGKGGINGRKVKIEVADDEYQPATAVQRCRELVQQKNAFLLIGGGGTDQIQACARYAESAGVPYLSAGVTEVGLRGLKGYFAASMSYKQQGSYLVSYMKRTFPDKAGKPAMVYSDTPNFKDARDAFVAAFGGTPVKEIKLSRVPSSTELANAARDLCTSGAQIAYPLMAPKDWITLVGSQTGPCVQWAGVGLTMGLNAVASTGCRTSSDKINGSRFFSPFPGLDKAASMDPDFASAIQGKSGVDDIYVALWATNEAVGELLNRAGKDLTRAAFVASTAKATGVAMGLNPPLNYSPDNHFGADTVHVLKLACNGNQGGTYVTESTFSKF